MTIDITSGLTPEQREAVLHRDGPLLILAGAGSGKTRVVTRRVAHLVATGVPRDAIVAITFTNKAAREMRERVAALIPPLSSGKKAKGRKAAPPACEVAIATFHSFAARFLRANAERIGFEPGFSILDDDDRLALVREAAIAARVSLERFSPPLLAHAIGRAKEALVKHSPQANAEQDAVLARGTDLEQAAARALPIYRLLARQRNALDFDDLVAESVRLLERDDEVRSELAKRLRYVLVDEYQDTNHAQYRLLQLLAAEHQNVFAVGDPDQSIYAFRGADISNIMDFERDFPGARTIALEQNYRSTNAILGAANSLIENNRERKPKRLFSELGEGDPVQVTEVEDEHAEARFVAAEIARPVEEGTSASEIAVFYRTNAQSRVLEDVLVRQDVPYQVIGGPRFYERAEIKDAVAYLSVLDNPSDAVALLRIANRPRRGIGDTSLQRLVTHADTVGGSLWESMADPEAAGVGTAAVKALRGFRTTMESLMAAAQELPIDEL
ncbi:UvrD-helicase domain-containing protein, partial [bacterium]|nr:UvrD-helicase domain-containing protein [bacterium]